MAKSRATWGVEEMDTGLLVAQGSAQTADEATREATHYALQYGQDGPVRYWVKQNRKILVQGSLNGVTITVTPNLEVTGGRTMNHRKAILMTNDSQKDQTEAAYGQSELTAGLGDVFVPEPRPSYKELLALIGEIDGIDLESEGYRIAVYLHIGDRKIKIIHDCGENISHHITRTGIACCIGYA